MSLRGWPVIALIGSLAAREGLAHDGPQGVTITPRDGGLSISAPRYAGVVGPDGCFTSLRVNGVEFFASGRGAYLYDKGIQRLTRVRMSGDNVVTAGSEKGSMTYEFGPEGMTWTARNDSDDTLLLIIVFNKAVTAAVDPRGDWWKTPLGARWSSATWYRDGATLRITGSTRVWGPWGDGNQVWQANIAPKEARTVTLSPNRATDEEIAAAREVASRVSAPPEEPHGPMWALARLSEPPRTYPAPEFEAEGVRALFYDSVPFRGRPTRVFAWIGLPEMKPGDKVPGVVLVHGGGGTAFDRWVRVWTERGYAAIAMDTCGCVPRGSYGDWKAHDLGGPSCGGGFDQINWPREDQWTYHAVSAAILAHSLLRSIPEVDQDRIGLTGISWGGYLTCILAGVDHRFKFAAPVYGCGYYLDTLFRERIESLGEDEAARWMRWWDPSAYLKDVAAPTLWVTGTNDFAYWLPGLRKSCRAVTSPVTLAVRLRMPHGHGPFAENPREIQVFADSILKGGKPLARITGQGHEDDLVWATWEGSAPIVRAEINVTSDTGNWPDRQWRAIPARLQEGGRVEAELPEDTDVFYLNLFDERGCVISTEHVEVGE